VQSDLGQGVSGFPGVVVPTTGHQQMARPGRRRSGPQ
jgi:hypothetical protein